MSAWALSVWNHVPWDLQPLIRWPLTAVYLIVLLLITIYGLHRYWLVYLYYRGRGQAPRPPRHFDHLPTVTVQLPMFNEGNVARRVIDAACRLNYPRHLLQIQVLDDSTDASAQISRRQVEYWSSQGVDIQYLHRQDRTGFKAGALADALPHVRGAFIAIFDADFVPPPAFLRRTIHYFTDPRVGMVQTRWDHLNRHESLLTRSQAIFLDAHFIIEHTARNRAHRWINFNGTAGIWRRDTIVDAGGWHHDTLTEDVDLSYRAQLAGWRFVFLPQVTCPSELPPEINAFKAQQHRWTKGLIETAKKLLPRLLRSGEPITVKIEAFFHLTTPLVYLYVTLMVLLFYPAIRVNTNPFEQGTLRRMILGLSLFTLGTTSAATFYVASQIAQRRSIWATMLQIPLLMSVGIGITLNNARACIEALAGHQSPFIRTPKYNQTSTLNPSRQTTPGRLNPLKSRIENKKTRIAVIATPSIKTWMSMLEIAMGLYMLQCVRLALEASYTVVSVPFLILFAIGYFYVGVTSLHSHWAAWRANRSLSLQPGSS